MKPARHFIHILLPLLLWACSGNAPSHPALLHAARLLDENPDSAAVADSLLLHVNPDSLSDADRNFHALLRVKADDKLFRQHYSDSLILSVVEYERKHQRRGLYPEALYYAGRVYTDLGDYPTAIDYFRQANDMTPDAPESRTLKSRILYHLVYSLNDLALYEAASEIIPYAIRLNRISGDSVMLADVLELCATIEYNRHEFEASRKYLLEARKIYSTFNRPDSLSVMTRLATIEAENGNIGKAISILAATNTEPDSLSRPYVYAARSRIYLKGGMTDSAYHYAMLLLNLNQPQNRHAAFSVLLNPALDEKMDTESRSRLVKLYAEELASHYAHRDSVVAYRQQLTYNYDLHLRREEKAERGRELWKYVSLTFILGTAACIILLLLKSIGTKRRTIALQRVII
ncbi:MAG: hypothetical protein K2G69_05255, partial [Muribaculaceae bacterium]|nr:hypothetical protein [Muribaculaceae bacterium]